MWQVLFDLFLALYVYFWVMFSYIKECELLTWGNTWCDKQSDNQSTQTAAPSHPTRSLNEYQSSGALASGK